MPCNPAYAKSCIRVYNPVDQAFTATVAPLVLEGTPVVESGCALILNTSSIQVNKSGLYHFSGDVVATPTTAGILTFQLYRDGVAVPSSIAQVTVAEGTAYTIHIETDLCIGVCCVNKPVFTFAVSGVSGTVNDLSVGALKLA